MATVADIIVSIHPGADSQGNVIGDTIWVLFDKEIDEQSIDEGNFLIEGPDTDSFIGPDVGFTLPNVSDSGSNDQLTSPGYQGIVPGKISFQRINLLDTNVYTGPNDTTGDGTLWRTKAIFTPAFPMQVETEYKVYLAGDELPGDPNPTGIRSRTVFDVLPDISNSGNGILTFSGSYTGIVDDVYHIVITTAGAPGIAWYEWYKDSDTVHRGPVLSDAFNSQELDKGVTVKFKSNNFTLNDEYTVVTKLPTIFSDNTYWIFQTGTGSIVTLPDSVSTSFTGDPKSLIPNTFAVISIIPADRASNLAITTKRIILTMNRNIDPTTVTADTVSIMGVAVNGDETLLQSREIFKDITVAGKKIIIDI